MTPGHTPTQTVKVSPMPPVKAVSSPTTKVRSDSNPSLTGDQPCGSESRTSQAATKGSENANWHRLEVIFAIGILLNAFVMLVEEQYRGLDAGFTLGMKGFSQSGGDLFPSAQPTFDVLHVVFNIMFTIELICRLYHDGLKFY